MYERILVGTDGSPSADRAITHALEQADRHGATLYGIFVVDTSRYGEPALSSDELVTDEIEDMGREYLGELEEQARDLDVEFVRRTCHGRPHEEIINYADDIDADMIVLGYQGQSHTQTDTIGSVAERVVRSGVRPTFVA